MTDSVRYRKFGKSLVRQQIPEYAANYINYKALKKIIKSLEDSSGPTSLQENKGTFFFKLERELEKVNAFYLQKEADLRLRLQTLLDKKRQVLSSDPTATATANSSLYALQEGFQAFDRDLTKLQQFVDLNATGFSKALKKWDKRSKSHTKELYLSSQVDVQPCFDREVITGLADEASASILELERWAGAQGEKIDLEALRSPGRIDLEAETVNAINAGDSRACSELVPKLEASTPDAVTSAFLRAIMSAPDEALLLILVQSPVFDVTRRDEITERGVLHEICATGREQCLQHLLQHRIPQVSPELVRQKDIYGRTPLHYAAMRGHGECVRALLTQEGVVQALNGLDHDYFSALVYAVQNGHEKCARLIVKKDGVVINPENPESEYAPLSLACAHGHLNIAVLLLEHGAVSAPNSEGLYPIHLAARAGHMGFAKIFGKENLDIKDKFQNWTPVFHAASEGHEGVLKELLQLGARVDIRDESGLEAAYHAAWEGHLGCMRMLLDARGSAPLGMVPRAMGTPSPMGRLGAVDLEVMESIPSLELPPPVIPFRKYGHNYLDNKTLVRVTLGHGRKLNGQQAAVELFSREAPGQMSSVVSARLVVRSTTDIFVLPHTFVLPLADETQGMEFQVDDVETFSLAFEIFPTFGSKIIGKGVALAPLLTQDKTLVVALMDPQLRIIGRVSFEVDVVQPFVKSGNQKPRVVETYWKSTVNTQPSVPEKKKGPQTAQTTTSSSLRGDNLCIDVAVTRDRVAVVYPRSQKIMVQGLQLKVQDVDWVHFKTFTGADSAELLSRVRSATNAVEAAQLLSGGYSASLRDFLEALPVDIGINMEIQPQERDVNIYVDAVLRDVFLHAENTKAAGDNTMEDQRPSTRQIMFSSCEPLVCTALNWKQPNYPLFFITRCCDKRMCLPAKYRQCGSIKDGVKFAKSNNLLGIIVDGEILTKVPPLVQSIKEAGLMLGATVDSQASVQDLETKADCVIGEVGSISSICRFSDNSEEYFDGI
ncbi:phosphate system positive regulatory protein pho81 [Saitoella coloradoensis]